MPLAIEPEQTDEAILLKRDPRWLLVQRIVHSETLGRSEQLSRLLTWVCRMTLTNRADEISEQRIGVELFRRPRDYDPGLDGIVRSHATRLRHRLGLYFQTEGANEEFIIEIPRGGYVPHFVPREQPAEAAVEAPPLAPPESVALGGGEPRSFWKQSFLRPFLAGFAVALFLAGAGLHLAWDHFKTALPGNGPAQTAIEHRFWNSIFPPGSRTLIVPGDSGLVLFEGSTSQEVTLSDYLGGSYRDTKTAPNFTADASRHFVLDLARRRYTSIVDLRLVNQLTHLPEWNPEHGDVVFARDLSPAAAQNNNLVLIGSRQANPWVSLVEPSMNFVLASAGEGRFIFANRHPRPGELSTYTPVPDKGNLGTSVVYGQIAYVPNPSGQGMVLVLCGLWMSGTQSAGNFVLSNREFGEWLRRIARPDGSIPPFELLIQTRNLEGSATGSRIVASRIAGR